MQIDLGFIPDRSHVDPTSTKKRPKIVPKSYKTVDSIAYSLDSMGSMESMESMESMDSIDSMESMVTALMRSRTAFIFVGGRLRPHDSVDCGP